MKNLLVLVLGFISLFVPFVTSEEITTNVRSSEPGANLAKHLKNFKVESERKAVEDTIMYYPNRPPFYRRSRSTRFRRRPRYCIKTVNLQILNFLMELFHLKATTTAV